ncbi:hypothetical protein Vau01_064030 [Virgisporangium aurantiacum]|uniref:Transposase IS701-like DDE domain-containing protein n=1 Tax=Virgisporangium aurantiacum TaxID=175570 RepID=A0A8J4E4F1_9ACTN|nr:hypothetical protein Vau01_064030 [Virgisporangium aurantiacum]
MRVIPPNGNNNGDAPARLVAPLACCISSRRLGRVAADWRLFCPPCWDDTTIAGPDKVAQVRRRRDRAGIGEEVRHREKWRLALDMFDEMIEQCGLPTLPVAADFGYGDCTLFRLGLVSGYRLCCRTGYG